MVITRNRFINDPTHNTLQADLYDSSKAEVLGRIETSAVGANMADWDWSLGHFLVIVWPDANPAHVVVTPYGDYMEPVQSSNEAGPVQVWETFTNPLVLRDGSDRDLTANMEVVLDIRHDYDLDIEDVTELLLFRAALVPKTWVDSFGDTIKKTATEIADCVDDVVDEKAKVDGSLRRAKKQNWKPAKKPAAKPVKLPAKKPTKKPTSGKNLTWKEKQQRRRERLAKEKSQQ